MGDFNISDDSGQKMIVKAFQEVGSEEAGELSLEKKVATEEIALELEKENPYAALFKKAARPSKKEILGRVNALLKKGEGGDKLEIAKIMKQHSDEYERRNPELKAKTLLALRERIKPGDTPEEILKKVKDFYPDVSLADEALDFLLETTEGTLHQEVLNAKNSLNEDFSREIIAGKNMGEIARTTEGLDNTPTDLRDLYRKITDDPLLEAIELFKTLSKLYPFKQMKTVFKFLFHSLGADMKSKGPSIPNGLLFNLMHKTKTLQAILSTYKFFAVRMPHMEKRFARDGIKMPQERLRFEVLAEQFIGLCSERFPTPEKVMKIAKELGLTQEEGKNLMTQIRASQAQIIVITQFRDAVHQVSLDEIFGKVEHRNEVLSAILTALDDLEVKLEDLGDKYSHS